MTIANTSTVKAGPLGPVREIGPLRRKRLLATTMFEIKYFSTGGYQREVYEYD